MMNYCYLLLSQLIIAKCNQRTETETPLEETNKPEIMMCVDNAFVL